MTDHMPVEEDGWDALAQKHWAAGLKGKAKVKAGVIKNEIWDRLERSNFTYASLVSLEGNQLLERYPSL